MPYFLTSSKARAVNSTGLVVDGPTGDRESDRVEISRTDNSGSNEWLDSHLSQRFPLDHVCARQLIG